MKLLFIAMVFVSCYKAPPIEQRRNCGIIIDMGYDDRLRSHVLYVMTGPTSQVTIPVTPQVYNSVAIDQRWCW